MQLPRGPPQGPLGTPNSSPAIVPPGRHARELTQRRGRVVDVAEQVGEGEPSNSPSANGSASRARLDELDFLTRCTSPAAALGEHLGALVDADDPAALLPDELACDCAGAGRDVEDAALPGPASIRETRKRRQRGSWPYERSAA